MPRSSNQPARAIPTRRRNTRAFGRSTQGTEEPAPAARLGGSKKRVGGAPVRRRHFHAGGPMPGISGGARDRRAPGDRSRESRGAPPAGEYGQGPGTSGRPAL